MRVLNGVRVLDFGRYIAGPYSAALLGDFGADVIRIEKLAGSEDRYMTPVEDGGVGGMFLQMNRNKRGLTLNPMKPEGREVVRRLVKTADVVVANLPAEGLKAMGIDYDSLTAIKPDIILTSASAFGNGGPYSGRVGFDGLGQAMSGGVFLAGPEELPTRDVLPIVDFGTAMMAAFGTMAALMHRDRTGEGQVVEAALAQTALTYSNSYLIEQQLTQRNRVSTGNRSQIAGPSDVFKTKDGWIMVQVVGQPLFERWVAMVGRPDLLEDERFSTDILRGDNGAVLSEIAQAHLAPMTTEEALALFAEAKVPAGPIYSPQQALDDPHVQAMDFFQSTQYGTLASAPVARAPVNLSKTPGTITNPAPQLGEHTDQILTDLGYGESEIVALREKRVV